MTKTDKAPDVCGLCKYGKPDPYNTEELVCMRNPPVAYPKAMADGTIHGAYALSPPVFHSRPACGEFKQS